MSEKIYGVGREEATAVIPAPDLPYRPPLPRDASALPIGLIGCGGITQSHLAAYREAGFHVPVLASRSSERAEARRAEFFPDADVVADWREVLARDDVLVVDITTHPQFRPPIVEAALRAGKHVLSQKPFVLDIETGRRLVALAEECDRRLAVNQNGRWAPHFSWMREAVRAGCIGEISTVDFCVQWDHHWICGTPFEQLDDLLLADFAIHWFDLAVAFFGERNARRVYAAVSRSPSQRARPPFLAHACLEFPDGQATLSFNADDTIGQEDRTAIVGSRGALRSIGPGLLEQRVTMVTAEGMSSPVLRGNWFRDGFIGTMGELLCAIEDGREPNNSARGNLRSLAVSFAAVNSARHGTPISLP
ncbi:MAG: Gfo/Idh/MocA family oxidoreductase [Chthoniobacteraceae bacterium]